MTPEFTPEIKPTFKPEFPKVEEPKRKTLPAAHIPLPDEFEQTETVAPQMTPEFAAEVKKIAPIEEAPKRRPPEIVRKLADVEVHVGEEVDLVCEFQGYPLPVVQWFQEDKPVTGERFKQTYVENVAVLHISPVTEEDDTGFECRATSELGTVSTFAEIYLFKPEVTERTEVAIEKLPEPLPEVEFIVQQPEEEVPVIETVTEVTTTTVTETVVVEEEKEEYFAPRVIKHLKDIDVTEKIEVRLQCEIIGYPAPTIEWYRDDVLIEETTERYTTTYEATTGVTVMVIHEVTQVDNTTFECRATNEIGTCSTFAEIYVTKQQPRVEEVTEVTTTTVTETVMEVEEYRAPQVTEQLEDVEVHEHETVTLRCVIVGHPRPTLEWYRDDVLINIEETERYTSTYEETGVSILTISEVTMEDNTGFECRATNEIGTVSTFCEIYLLKAPSPERIERTEIEIQKEAEPLQEIEFILQQPEQQEIEEVTTIERTTVVEEVEYRAPQITRHLEDIEVTIGESVELICEITAIPRPTIQWYRDEVLIDVEQVERYTTVYEETGVSILKISEITEEEDAGFECRATNELGTISTFCDLYLQRAPSPERRERTEIEMETQGPKLEEVEFVIFPEEEQQEITVEEVQERTEVMIEREEAPKQMTLHLDVGKPAQPEVKLETRRKVTETIEMTMEKVEEEIPMARTKLEIQREAQPLQPIELIVDVPKPAQEELIAPEKIQPVKEPIVFQEKPEVQEEVLQEVVLQPEFEEYVMPEEQPVFEEKVAPEVIKPVKEPIVFQEHPQVEEQVLEQVVLQPEFEELVMPVGEEGKSHKEWPLPLTE